MKDFIIGLAIGLALLWVLFRVNELIIAALDKISPPAQRSILWMILGKDKKPIFSWKEPGKQYISYRTYRRLSAIAPDRWEIVNGHIWYSHREEGSKRLYMDSPISAFQLWLHIRKKEKDDDRYRDSKEMEKLIKSWKMDLDEFNRREENESSGNHHI